MSGKRILITGARAPHALHLARVLHERGHTVFTGETSCFNLTHYSNSIEKNFIVPSPRYHQQDFIAKLIEIIQHESIDLVIPTWEEALYLSQAKEKFPKECVIFTSDFETVHKLHNKWLFYKLVISFDLKSPKTSLVLSPEDLQKVNMKGPFALKSSYSRASQSIYKIEPGKKIPDLHFMPSNHWIAQEWIEGKKFCSYSVCHNGKVSAHSTYPVEYAIDDKSCLTFEAIRHPLVEKWVENFAKKLSYTGQMAFDFIQQGEELYVIECNPRSTSGLMLFDPETEIDRAFLNTEKETIYPVIPTKRQIASGMLMYGWRTHPDDAEKSFLQTFVDFDDVVFNKNDLFPFVSQSWLYFYYLWMSHQLNISIPAFFTHDLDWNGQQ